MADRRSFVWRREMMRFSIWNVLYRLWIKMHVSGWENIPANGPVIMMGNHINMLDPVVMISFYPDRDIVPLSKAEAFDMPILRTFVNQWGAIHIFRSHNFAITSGLGYFDVNGKFETTIRPAFFEDVVVDQSTYQPTPVPEIKFRKQVSNIPGNYYNYEGAKALCSAYGAEVATYDQIEDAYNNGAEWCNYGWSANQLALFPTQKKTYDTLQTIPGDMKMIVEEPVLTEVS